MSDRSVESLKNVNFHNPNEMNNIQEVIETMRPAPVPPRHTRINRELIERAAAHLPDNADEYRKIMAEGMGTTPDKIITPIERDQWKPSQAAVDAFKNVFPNNEWNNNSVEHGISIYRSGIPGVESVAYDFPNTLRFDLCIKISNANRAMEQAITLDELHEEVGTLVNIRTALISRGYETMHQVSGGSSYYISFGKTVEPNDVEAELIGFIEELAKARPMPQHAELTE